MSTIAWEDFERVDLRAGTILTAEPLAGARKPAIRMTIDFGPLGVRQSSAQITDHYAPPQLVGRQILAVVNFPPKRIAGFESQVLVTGLADAGGKIVLIAPDQTVPNGARLC